MRAVRGYVSVYTKRLLPLTAAFFTDTSCLVEEASKDEEGHTPGGHCAHVRRGYVDKAAHSVQANLDGERESSDRQGLAMECMTSARLASGWARAHMMSGSSRAYAHWATLRSLAEIVQREKLGKSLGESETREETQRDTAERDTFEEDEKTELILEDWVSRCHRDLHNCLQRLARRTERPCVKVCVHPPVDLSNDRAVELYNLGASFFDALITYGNRSIRTDEGKGEEEDVPLQIMYKTDEEEWLASRYDTSSAVTADCTPDDGPEDGTGDIEMEEVSSGGSFLSHSARKELRKAATFVDWARDDAFLRSYSYCVAEVDSMFSEVDTDWNS